MADDSTELRDTLARLHEQLRGAQNVTPEARALLQGAMQDIHALLNEPPSVDEQGSKGPAKNEQQDSIAQRLRAAELEFEATHPTLAGIVGSVIDALARMGI